MKNNYRPVEDNSQPKNNLVVKLLKRTELGIRMYTYAERAGLVEKLENVDFAEIFQSILEIL